MFREFRYFPTMQVIIKVSVPSTMYQATSLSSRKQLISGRDSDGLKEALMAELGRRGS
jgi:hypothetical protein